MSNSETKKFSQNISSSYHLGAKCSGECKNDSLNIPKLRFKGYNEEWKHYRLKDIVQIYDGTHQTPNYINDGIKFVSVENINNLEKTSKYISKEDYEKDFKIKPAINDILMTRIGDIGTPAIINTNERYAYYVSLALLKSNYEILSPKFLIQRIFSEQFQHELWKRTLHVAFPKKINKNEIGECNIFVPSLPEQEKIASFLTLIDKKIAKQKELVELLKKYKRGLLSQIFSQKLRFKDDNGNYYPNWEEKRLGDICKIVGGGTPDTNNIEYWGDDINWFTPTEIIKKYAYSSNRKISKLGLLKSSAKILPIGTVLLTTRATLGEMSILSIEATTNQGFQSLVPIKDKVTSEFIYYCQPIIKHFCYKYANGSTFLEISKQTLAKLKLMIPNKDEQNKISEFLSKFDDKIQQEESLLNYLQIYKKGLLQQMFI